jgi:DNA invertase Pin-like site-specific DNA recombinase
MIYGYARVSTIEQNLDRQIKALEEEGCSKIFTDKITGATTERPQFQELLSIVNKGDSIIITDLTRFTRSTKDLFTLIELLKEKEVNLRSIKDTWLDISGDNPYSAFLITVMAGVNQLERDLIKMRQKEGIAIAKEKGIYRGRPKTFTEHNPRLKHALDLYEGGGYSVKEVCNVTGISPATFYRQLKKRREAQ